MGAGGFFLRTQFIQSKDFKFFFFLENNYAKRDVYNNILCLTRGVNTECSDICFVWGNSQKLCTVQSVNCRDIEGRQSTPLHFAAGYNRVSVVEYLLQHGADVHAKDKG